MIDPNTYFLDILIPFDLLVDTDIGAVRLVTEKYNDHRYFDTSRLSNTDEGIYKFLFTYRLRQNPLFLITRVDLKLGQENIIDDIYKELMEKEYVEVLRHSFTTSLYSIFLAGTYSDQNPFRITVICKNELDVQYLKEIKFKCSTVICKDSSEYTNIEIDKYKYIYVKYIENALDFRYMDKKVIYVANYRFNKEFAYDKENNQDIEVLKPNIVIDIMSDNIIKIIDVYPTPGNISI